MHGVALGHAPGGSKGIKIQPLRYADAHQFHVLNMRLDKKLRLHGQIRTCWPGRSMQQRPSGRRPDSGIGSFQTPARLSASWLPQRLQLGFLAWGAGVLVQYSSKCCVSPFMAYVNNAMLVQAHADNCMLTQLKLPHYNCMTVMCDSVAYAMNSFCSTASFARVWSHYFAAAADH